MLDHAAFATLSQKVGLGIDEGLGESCAPVRPIRLLADCRFDRNAATSQCLQDRVVVESQPLSDGDAREPSFVQLGCDGDLGLGHPAR